MSVVFLPREIIALAQKPVPFWSFSISYVFSIVSLSEIPTCLKRSIIKASEKDVPGVRISDLWYQIKDYVKTNLIHHPNPCTKSTTFDILFSVKPLIKLSVEKYQRDFESCIRFFTFFTLGSSLRVLLSSQINFLLQWNYSFSFCLLRIKLQIQ